MSFLRFGMCQLRNKAAGMSSHSIREFKVMIKRLKLPPKGEWIMVNEVEGAPRPAVSSICTSRAPPASIPEQSAARNIDAFAKPGLRLSLRASRIAMNPRRRPHTSPATAPSRVAVTEPSAVAPKAPITVVAGTTTRKGPRRSQRVVFMVDTEVPPIRMDGRTSPVRWELPLLHYCCGRGGQGSPRETGSHGFRPLAGVDAPEGADPSSCSGHTSLLSVGCRGLFGELAEPFVAPGKSTRAQIVGNRADPLQLGLERGALVLGLEQEESGQALRSGTAKLGVDPGHLVLERGHPRLELAQRVLGLQQGQQGDRSRELGELPRGCGQDLVHPLPKRPAALVGQLVDGPLRPLLLSHRLPGCDQTETPQTVDRLVDARPLAHVDDLVLAALLDELLHPVGVHRRLVQETQHRQAQGRTSAASFHSHNVTRIIITSQDTIYEALSPPDSPQEALRFPACRKAALSRASKASASFSKG